jgi:hypothetical protein
MTIADAGLRRTVQVHLPKSKGWLWTPIETGATHAGVPDSFWAHEPSQTSGWIEHKATGGWAVAVRPHQIAWMERHVRAGVHCVVLIRAGGLGSSNREGDALWAVAGHSIRLLNEMGLQKLPEDAVLGRWNGYPDQWDWYRLEQILTGKGWH